MDVSIFEMETLLGTGAFGSVWRARHADAGVFAIKELPAGDPRSVEEGDRFVVFLFVLPKHFSQVQHEIDILKVCRHVNIVSYFGTITERTKMWIIMEYCEIALRDLIEKTDKVLSEGETANITLQTLKGLVYLHNRSVIHRGKILSSSHFQ